MGWLSRRPTFIFPFVLACLSQCLLLSRAKPIRTQIFLDTFKFFNVSYLRELKRGSLITSQWACKPRTISDLHGTLIFF